MFYWALRGEKNSKEKKKLTNLCSFENYGITPLLPPRTYKLPFFPSKKKTKSQDSAQENLDMVITVNL